MCFQYYLIVILGFDLHPYFSAYLYGLLFSLSDISHLKIYAHCFPILIGTLVYGILRVDVVNFFPCKVRLFVLLCRFLCTCYL